MQAVFGIGNIDRRDDGIGVHVINLIQNEPEKNLQETQTHLYLIENDVFCLDEIFLNAEKFERALFIDAMKSGNYEVGTVVVFSLDDTKPSKTNFATLTHNISILEYLRMVESTQPSILPDEMTVLGIVIDDLSFKRGLSSKIEKRLPLLKTLIQQWIKRKSINGTYSIKSNHLK